MVLFPKNTYWLLPTPIRNLLNRLVEARSSWELHLRKDQDGCYYFNYPPIAWNESLCGGTEKCVDYHFVSKGYDLQPGEKVKLTVSANHIHNHSTILYWVGGDGTGGNYYHDEVANKEMWLCGVNQLMFGFVPSAIWVSVEPCP